MPVRGYKAILSPRIPQSAVGILRLREALVGAEKGLFKDKQLSPDHQTEINYGSFPHGGGMHMKCYFTKKRKAASRSKAEVVLIREMKGNEIVFEKLKYL